MPRLVRELLGDRVADLVAGHVAAKRYLVTVDPSYRELLSGNSTKTLERQGDAFTADEVTAFERSPLADDWIALRRASDRAKVSGLVVPGLPASRNRWSSHARAGTTNLPGNIDRFPEGCESGRIGTLGKRVWGNSPWVRIPLPPPNRRDVHNSRAARGVRRLCENLHVASHPIEIQRMMTEEGDSSDVAGSRDVAESVAVAGSVGVADSVAVAGSGATARSVAVAGSVSTAGSVAVAQSAATAGSVAVAGSAGTAGSVAVAGSAGTAGSVAVAGSAGTAFSVGVIGSLLTLLGVGIRNCVATVACIRCRRCIACVGCIDCVDCIGCVGCVGLRGAVGQRNVHA